ncbi:MAG: RidA family protein [Chloroflexota bacterium]
MLNAENKLKEMGLTLPNPPKPVGSYLLAKRVGNLLFLSGSTCYTDNGLLYKGRVGSDLTVENGYEAARQTMLVLLSVLKNELGSLERIEQIIKVNGYVNSAPDFDQQPAVMNGASDLLLAIFGDRGTHARTSVGVNELPGHIPIEIEMVVQVNE